MRVLVIDDEAPIRLLCRLNLEEEGIDVLEAEGFALTVVPVRRNGVVDPEAIAEAMGDDVALVSVMAVNNETGVIQPVAEIGAIAKQAGAVFHVDAVQAPGRIAISVDGWQADLVSIAAHKFHGVLGAAALFVRRRTRLEPLVRGGQHERGLRAGTESRFSWSKQ